MMYTIVYIFQNGQGIFLGEIVGVEREYNPTNSRWIDLNERPGWHSRPLSDFHYGNSNSTTTAVPIWAFNCLDFMHKRKAINSY